MNYRYSKLYPRNVSTFKKGVIILSLLSYGILGYFLTTSIIRSRYFQNVTSGTGSFDFEEPPTDGYVINTAGCKIPYFDPFDQQIQKYIKKPKILICNQGKPALFESNLTSIYLLKSSLLAYSITEVSQLKCCYNVFRRIEPKDRHADTSIAFDSECIKFNGSSNINEEFIKVTCHYHNLEIYKDMFSFIPVDKIKSSLKLVYPAPLNVLVIGMDSVSRLNLHRQLPSTVDYLKSIGAVELLGYNKVADNTYPNLIPVLTGLSEEELNSTCVPKRKDHFDNCPLIWNHYKDQGYVTAYGEDAAYMGLFNNQGLKGFKKQPTDFGYNYFSRVAENDIGNNFFVNVDFCQSSRFVYKDFLYYVKKFVVTMHANELPYFAFFWGVSLSHDDLNMLRIGDKDYYDFFKTINDKNMLNNTAVIFLSDHGIRFGKIRQTYQGRMEERLPFLFMLLPQWFKDVYKSAIRNLLRNTRRLTTPFDLHETLMDLIYQENMSGESESYELSVEVNETSRGISLFKDISKERTCEQAGIVSHWCTCQESNQIQTNEEFVIKSASYAVRHINLQLRGYIQCANLTMTEITDARVMTHQGDVQGKHTIKDYVITFITVPGEAVFEATVRYSPFDDKFQVIGTISRLNLYGKQSFCITDFHLKLYCFCENLLPDWISNNNIPVD